MGYELTKDLETGNRIVDDEHRELFRIANQLLEAYDRGEPMASLRPVIRFLIDHATKHFEHEEALQEQSGYPDAESHREFHLNYQRDLKKVLLQIPPTGPTITDIVNLTGLFSVLIDHVKTDDRNMCDFLKQRS